MNTQAGKPEGAGDSVQMELGQLVGRVLGGRYQLNELIGSGGMGEIYRARRTHIGDTVAVKVLRADVVANEKSRQRFYREARAAALLHHPNAVVIHDFGEDADGLAYIVMELLLGRSLRQVLNDEGALNPVRAYGILRQACAALEAGHRSGIIHRDIKPDNIVLLSHDDEESDHVKILDFGIAKLRDKALDTLSVENSLTNVGTVIGTPNYMSPEQCQGEEADARSDVYSLGVVLYELLTGQMPFVAKTPTGVAIKHVTEKPRPPRELRPDLPAEVEAVVLHALEKAPEARPQTMLEFARAFAASLKQASATTLLEGGKPGAPLTSPIETPRTDEVRATSRPQTQANDDERVTAIMLQAPATASADEFRTQVGAPVAAAPFDTMVGVPESAPADAPRDEYATNVPAAPDAPVHNPFATQVPTPATELLAGTEVLPQAERPAILVEPKPLKSSVEKPAKSAAPVIDLPPQNYQVKTSAQKAAGKSGSQKVILLGVAAVLLVVALVVWSLLTKGNKPPDEPKPVQNAGAETAQPTAPKPPPGMIYLPGGELKLGREDGEENEKPARTVIVAPFFLDQTEITNEQYARFIESTGYTLPPSWQGKRYPADADKLPVTDVTWADANEYAKWARKRLPTEEEWEFAARGAEGRLYPWGNEWQEDLANIAKDESDKRQLAPVGTYLRGQSFYGALDLIGNVWEWTASDYQAYPGGKPLPTPEGYSNLKVIRGGSYASLPKQATATYRRGWPATRKDWPQPEQASYAQTGLRCAQDAPQR